MSLEHRISLTILCVFTWMLRVIRQGFVYLIGLIVVANGSETHYSYWADNKDQETIIFEQFVAEITRHDEFVVFCYGNYEQTFIKRMKKVAKNPELVDKIEDALVNILSYIYAYIYFPLNVLKQPERDR